ncbi:MAG TPA: hypothetical protein VFT31_16040 [Kribbella sp.]|nr:hypothetical protein [Kribbella sp.]
MINHRLLTFAALTTLALSPALAGCSSAKDSGAPSPSADTSTTATPAVSAKPTSPSTKPAAGKTRTKAELKKALLTLGDMPSGFSIEPEEADGGGDVRASSTKSACARLVALTNADNPPGSKASAHESFSGGLQGPFIDEGLDAMGSAKAVATLQQNFRNAIKACRSMKLTIPGEGSSTVSVRLVSAPQAGTSPVAVRFTATSGPFEGLEVTMVTTGVDDVVVSLTIVAGVPEDVDGATEAAVGKAREVLGAKSGT